MKRLLILFGLLSTLIFYSCKTNLSDTSFLVETNGRNFYLFGTSTGKDKTPIVCRFICSNLPTQQTKGQLCTSPIYIEKVTLEKSENLSIFLEEIESQRVYVRKITETEKNTINTLYTVKEKTGTYDLDIGEPNEVCNKVLNPTNNQVLPVLSTDESSTSVIKLKDLFNCDYVADISVQRNIYRKTAFTNKRTVVYKGFIIKGSASECINKKLLNKNNFQSYSINHSGFSAETEDTLFLKNIKDLTPNTHYSFILMNPDYNNSYGKNKENGNDEFDVNEETFINIMYHNFTYNLQNQENFRANTYDYLDFRK